jgi:hypothetical protein
MIKLSILRLFQSPFKKDDVRHEITQIGRRKSQSDDWRLRAGDAVANFIVELPSKTIEIETRSRNRPV